MNTQQRSMVIDGDTGIRVWIQTGMETNEWNNITVHMVSLCYIHYLTLRSQYWKRPWTEQLTQLWFSWCYHSKLLVVSMLNFLHRVSAFLLMQYFPKKKEEQLASTDVTLWWLLGFGCAVNLVKPTHRHTVQMYGSVCQ